ncbi:MAG: 2-methylcitrate dehydratase, partial [Pseudomonadota bacterium]
PYREYVIQHVMLKSVPCGMYGQTAVECAIAAHALVRNRIDSIERIDLHTQRSLLGIMNKTGPLRNHADRDHSVQYIVAIGLLFGRLTPADCNDDVAADLRIDALRDKMNVIEDPSFTRGSADPEKLSSGNGIQIYFRDGSSTPRIDIEYPAGHPSRRDESAPLFRMKFMQALETCFVPEQRDRILAMCDDRATFEQIPVSTFMAALAT